MYLSFIVFVISPKVTNYLIELETKQVKSQLEKISYLVSLKEHQIKRLNLLNNKSYDKKSVLTKEIEDLLSFVKGFYLKSGEHVFILDEYLKVIVHPENSLINESLKKEKYHNVIDIKNFKKQLNEASRNKTILKYNWNKINNPNYPLYQKYAWVDYNKFFGWYIISSIYQKDLEKKAKEIDSLVRNTSGVFFLVLTIILIIYIKKFLKPLELLSKNARLVEAGDLKVRTNIQSKDEFGVLAKHFNNMLDSIEENTKDLEEKIKERTLRLQKRLYYDELTGLKNRESLIESIKNEDFVTINFIDINDFDHINELYGFQVGNEVLIKVANRLQEFAKGNKLELYRVNGDVFALKDIDIVRFLSYDKMIDKIHELFVKEFKVESLGVDLYLSITLGVSISQSEPVKYANTALNKAKQSSLKTVVYNKNINTKDNIEKMMHWKDKIKYAIENDNVVPFFQGIFNKNEQIIKYEALMRIKEVIDGETYYLSPGDFFDVAIKTKQYFKLNQIIIKKAFNSIDKLEKMVSVNISFSDISNLDFIDFLEYEVNLLTQEQREKLIFEILESDFISDHKILDDFILKYRQKGIKFAIDDFGTGYSNFTHVLNIKPEYIKIDGSLIKNIHKDQTSYEMVKSIIDFCKALKIIVVVEYIHNQEVYSIVKKLGADEYQGFYLAKPKGFFN